MQIEHLTTADLAYIRATRNPKRRYRFAELVIVLILALFCVFAIWYSRLPRLMELPDSVVVLYTPGMTCPKDYTDPTFTADGRVRCTRVDLAGPQK